MGLLSGVRMNYSGSRTRVFYSRRTERRCCKNGGSWFFMLSSHESSIVKHQSSRLYGGDWAGPACLKHAARGAEWVSPCRTGENLFWKSGAIRKLGRRVLFRQWHLSASLSSWISLARNFASLEPFECPSQE